MKDYRHRNDGYNHGAYRGREQASGAGIAGRGRSRTLLSGLIFVALLLAGFTGIGVLNRGVLNSRQVGNPEPAGTPSLYPAGESRRLQGVRGEDGPGENPGESPVEGLGEGSGGDLLDRVRAAGPDFERRVTGLAKEAVERFVRTGVVMTTATPQRGYKRGYERAGRHEHEYEHEHGREHAGQGEGAAQEEVDLLLSERAGVFVTIIANNRVRGCVGSISPQQDSIEAEIIHNAVMAASADMRHPPVREDELVELGYSVAIVGRVERVDPGMEFDPGAFGVLVTPVPGGEGRAGVILPGEARTWSKAVSWAMQEAGISSGEVFEVQRFQAASFGKKLELYR
ncbi:MAG: AMMECR1 domain-containing protein [Firmicutes bacterium]|nr:AMMECR1 domain-containing protein [Bacillota bacterium]